MNKLEVDISQTEEYITAMQKKPTLPHPRKARDDAGLRQVDVASRSGLSLQTVVRAEKSGKYPRSIPLKLAYLRALSIA